MVLCKCVFLDGKEVFLTVEKDATGSDLFDSICEYIGIKYRDPFGVAFRGGAAPAPYSWWVRMDKSLTGQIPGKCKIWEFAFLVKYYPKTLTGMQDVMARHHVILQIRQDLLTGRLKCPIQTMSHLCSYWLQSEYGDWCSRHIDMQLADAFRFVQKGESSDGQNGRSDLNFEEQMMQMHRTHRGMSAIDAEYRFIRLAASLPNYGIHYYPTIMFPQQPHQQAGRRSSILSMSKGDNTTKGEKVTIGVGPLGIHQFRRKGNEIVFTWKAMRAVSFKKNRIVLKMQGALRQNADHDIPENNTTNKKNLTKEYEFSDMFQTKIVWQVMIEYHMFFRVGDQQGLKGNQRKQLLSSLKVKRTIPVVGEKKVESQSKSPTAKNSPKSSRKFSFDRAGRTPKTRASSLPPSRGTSADRQSSPSRMSLRERPRRDTTGASKLESARDEGVAAGFVGKPERDNEPGRIVNTVVMKPDETPIGNKRNVATPATPMSGTFFFPQRSTRSRSSSVGRLSTNAGEVPFDALSMASDDTDELCNPDVLHATRPNKDDEWNESISPRSQHTVHYDVPKLQLDDDVDNSKGDPDDSARHNHDEGPFVIPAEILIEDLRKCRKMKDQGAKIEPKSSEFPIELDFKYQPRRSQYLNDANLIDAYDHEFSNQTADSSYAGRRSRSLASLRPRSKWTDARSSSRERSMSPMSERNTTLPKTTESQTPRTRELQWRQPPQKAKSETRLLQTALRNRGGRSATSSSYVAHLSEPPAVKPRQSVPSLKREKKEDTSTKRHSSDVRTSTLMPSNSEAVQQRSRVGRTEKGNTIPKIPIFIRSVV